MKDKCEIWHLHHIPNKSYKRHIKYRDIRSVSGLPITVTRQILLFVCWGTQRMLPPPAFSLVSVGLDIWILARLKKTVDIRLQALKDKSQAFYLHLVPCLRLHQYWKIPRTLTYTTYSQGQSVLFHICEHLVICSTIRATKETTVFHPGRRLPVLNLMY